MISEKSKYYFYDVGIKNALIADLREIEKSDPKEVGLLFENFFISEHLKKCRYTKQASTLYFYKDYEQRKVDLIEKDVEGNIKGFEIKFNPTEKVKIPKKLTPNFTFKWYTPTTSSNLLLLNALKYYN